MESDLTLQRFNQVLLALLLVFGLLYLGQAFIIPVAIGGLFAMLLVPVCKKLEKWGLPPTMAAILCVFTVVIVLIIVFTVLINQLVILVEDLPQLGDRLTALLEEAHHYVRRTIQVSREEQIEYVQQALRDSMRYAGLYLRSLLLFAGSAVISFIIVMSYTLLFLLYRHRLVNFVSRLASRHNANASTIVRKITDVANSYIAGVFLVVLILSTVNSIGLMLIGIEHALLFGLMAGLLNIIPYLGSIAGSLIPVIFALLTKDSLWYPVLVLLFFLAVQQVESYILTPNITGAKVKLNPMATLMVLLLGGVIWGIAGMILFVPYLGIAKVIFDHVQNLQPYGYVLGKDDEEEDTS